MLKVLAPAKINLCLDILDKDSSSGYHQIQTIIHEIPSLHNEITLTESETSSDHPALTLLQNELGLSKHIKIEIKQGIPHSSGLGGHSSNCAAILKALNQLWSLSLSDTDLSALAAKLGMDVPFFLQGGTAFATNFGEKITPLTTLDLQLNITPQSSPFTDKTKRAYQGLELSLCGKNTSLTKTALTAIKNADIDLLKSCFHNDFETLTPIAKNQHLSGAGPSTFTV